MQKLSTLTARYSPSAEAGHPASLISTSIAVLALFAATTVIGVGLVFWIMRLRVGVYEFESLPIFQALFVLLDYWPAIVAVIISAIGLLRPVQLAGIRLVEAMGNRPYLTSAVTFALLAVGARFVYQAHPLSMDEYAPYFQSRAFAAGHLSGRFPIELLDWLVPPGFQNVFLTVSRGTGQVASAYMPGFALLLTPFMAFGVPWLCNPALGAASMLVLHRFVMELFDDKSLAGLAMLLAAASSAFFVNAISFYSMSAHALANLLFALLLLEPSVRRCFAAGLVGSIALVLHNPFPHALFALPWLLWLFLRPDRLRTVPAIAAGYLPLFLLCGIGWTLFSADLQSPVTQVAEANTGLVQRWAGALTDFLRPPSAEMLFMRGMGLAKLWIWSVPVLVVAAAAGVWAGRSDRRIRLIALSCATTLTGFLFVVFSQGHGWGFRYFHSAWLCLPLLAVALVRVPVSARVPHTMFSYVAGVAALALVTLLPLQLWQVNGFITRHLEQLPVSAHGSPRVVIINPSMGYYAADLVQNDPFLREPVVRMITHGRSADREMIRRHFPDLAELAHSYRGEIWGADRTE